jgi:hypothetical protein
VTGGAAVQQQSASSGEDVNHPFAQQAAGAKTLAEFKLNVPGPTIGTGQDYFIHFRPAGSDSNNFVARCWIGPPTAGGSYDIGIAAGSLSTTPVVPWTSDLTFGQTYKIWILYDGVTGTSTLWVNPVDRNSPSVSSTSAPLAGRLLASIALRQASPTGASYTQVIDDLEVDIAPSPPVPSLSQWGLMALASILVLAGGLYVARRRTATA